MVGGKVIGVVRGEVDTLVNVNGEGDDCLKQLSVRCIERRLGTGTIVAIDVGDFVWWQGPWVLWTPSESAKCESGVDFDIKLPKLGFSH